MQQESDNGQLIYVIDSDSSITRLIALNLTAKGYEVKVFSRGHEALAILENDRPNLVLMGLLLPDCDGLEIARLIRQCSAVPIIILSVLDEMASKIAALDSGVDDYITKPFRMEELLARVRAILRRTFHAHTALAHADNAYRYGGLLIDLHGMTVTSHNKNVSLTPREWSTLQILMENVGRVVSPKNLLHETNRRRNGTHHDNARAYITRLRRKLEPDPHNPRYILSERGLGYRLVDPD
ncbi:MAG: hypothetical protein BZY75_05145 [SAR202 cluster bacterium Io17-Chloro-G7]|nr:MAG: hypothetical protein BZY75_05145 [SAR202 cluster bacterium Io17-Chloro-G7]